jgi:hypothetical protein
MDLHNPLKQGLVFDLCGFARKSRDHRARKVHDFGVAGHLFFIPQPNERTSRPARKASNSLSVIVTPSIRVEDPTDSMVAIFFKAFNRSGAREPIAFQAPLDSSIRAISPKISFVMVTLGSFIWPFIYTQKHTQKYPKNVLYVNI